MITSHIYTPDKLDMVLGLKICKREVDELKAQGLEPKEALKQSLESSKHAWYFLDEGMVRGAGGIVEHKEHKGMGIVWVLCDEIMLKKYLFTCNSWAYEGLEFCFNTLNLYCVCNFVSLNNKLSIKWLKSLGFEFMQSYKVFKDPEVIFDEFYMYKEDFLNV